jgi:hypothetical protein
VPALSRSRGHVDGSTADDFARWRYTRVGAESVVLDDGGRRRTVFFRRQSRFGASILQLLDVIDERAMRVMSSLAKVCLRLPGPGIVLSRGVAAAPSLSSVFVRVPRKWATPFIVKEICCERLQDSSFHEIPFTYGDIDAS